MHNPQAQRRLPPPGTMWTHARRAAIYTPTFPFLRSVRGALPELVGINGLRVRILDDFEQSPSHLGFMLTDKWRKLN